MNLIGDGSQIEEHSMLMTLAMQSWLILCVLPLSTLAIRCYSDTTTGGSKPRYIVECDSEMCYKMSVQQTKAAQYGCGAICLSNSDSCTKTNDITQCCCKKSLCNSSRDLSTILMFSSFITLTLLR